MTKRSSKQSKKFILYSIFIAVLTLFACFSVGYFLNSGREYDQELFYKNKVKHEFDIILPEDCKLIYSIEDDRGDYRDADPTYCVFEFAEEPTDFFEKNNFKNERNIEFEEKVKRVFEFRVKDSKWYVPPKYCPNFSINYRYFDSPTSSGFVIYHTHYKYLYVYFPGDY